MKKFGVLIFILALILGLAVANIFSFGKVNASDYFNFSFNRSVRGSGNIVSDQRNVGEFTSVDASGVYKIEIVAQKDFAVSVEADDNLLPFIKTEVSNGVLKVYSEKKIRSKNALRIRISAPNIEKIEASGATNIDLSGINNSSLELDTSGASKVSVAGETVAFKVDVSGASKINAAALKADKATIDASGASRVSVNAVSELNADASGASTISYTGSPVNLNNRATGAAKIKQD